MVGSRKLLNPAGEGSPPLSVKTNSPGSLSELLYASHLIVWETDKTCKYAALVTKSGTCGRPKVGTFHKPRRVCQHWSGVRFLHHAKLAIYHSPRICRQICFVTPSASIFAINEEIQLLMLKTCDAFMSFDFKHYRITSLYHAHITDFDCLFVGYCSKASARCD